MNSAVYTQGMMAKKRLCWIFVLEYPVSVWTPQSKYLGSFLKSVTLWLSALIINFTSSSTYSRNLSLSRKLPSSSWRGERASESTLVKTREILKLGGNEDFFSLFCFFLGRNYSMMTDRATIIIFKERFNLTLKFHCFVYVGALRF